jgi:hypothetical protein
MNLAEVNAIQLTPFIPIYRLFHLFSELRSLPDRFSAYPCFPLRRRTPSDRLNYRLRLPAYTPTRAMRIR